MLIKCLKQGIKNRRKKNSAIFVLNRIRVWGAAPHLPTQGYIESTPPPVIYIRYAQCYPYNFFTNPLHVFINLDKLPTPPSWGNFLSPQIPLTFL